MEASWTEAERVQRVELSTMQLQRSVHSRARILRWMSYAVRPRLTRAELPCDVVGDMRARGGCRRERVERACIDTGQPAVCGLLIVAGVTAIKQSLSLPKAD